MSFSLIESKVRPNYYKKQTNLEHRYTGISPNLYFRFLLDLDDDYLTEWEVQKFRVLFREKINQGMLLPVLSFPVFYVMSPKLMGIYIDRIQYYRPIKIFVALTLSSAFVLMASMTTFASKPFHEIVTQPEPNGQYVRRLLAHNMPRQWARVSKDLYNQGYNFREMNEYSHKDIMPDVTDKFDNTWY